jgi:hypothetical protein
MIDGLAEARLLEHELTRHDEVRDNLVYYPTVTREPFRNGACTVRGCNLPFAAGG